MPLYRGSTIAPADAVDLGTTQVNQIWYGENLVHPTDVGDPPGPVTGLTFNPSTTSIFVDWTAPADTGTTDPATQYRIEWDTDTNYDNDNVRIVSDPTTATTIAGLTANTTYHIRVRAENLGGVSAWEDGQVYTSTTTVVFAPEFEYTTGTNYIDLTWDHPSEGNRPTSYLIQWRPSTSTSYTGQNNPTPADGTSFRISSLTPDTTYFVRIRASIGASIEAFSDEEEIRTMASAAVAPGPVRNLASTYTPSSANQIRVSWTAPNSGGTPTTYRIQWNEFGTSEANFAAGSELSSFTLAILISARGGYNRTNYIRVRAENTHGNGAWRNIERVTTLPTLATPTNVSGTATNVNAINVTWDNVGAGEYRVEIGTSPSSYGHAGTVRGFSLNVTGLQPDTEYYFRVRSEYTFTSSGASNYAGGDSTTTYAALPPRNINGSRDFNAGGTNVHRWIVTWEAPTNNLHDNYSIGRRRIEDATFTTISSSLEKDVVRWTQLLNPGSSDGFVYQVVALYPGGHPSPPARVEIESDGTVIVYDDF